MYFVHLIWHWEKWRISADLFPQFRLVNPAVPLHHSSCPEICKIDLDKLAFQKKVVSYWGKLEAHFLASLTWTNTRVFCVHNWDDLFSFVISFPKTEQKPYLQKCKNIGEISGRKTSVEVRIFLYTWSSSPRTSPSTVFSSVSIFRKNIFIEPKWSVKINGSKPLKNSFWIWRFSFSVSRLINAAKASRSEKSNYFQLIYYFIWLISSFPNE